MQLYLAVYIILYDCYTQHSQLVMKLQKDLVRNECLLKKDKNSAHKMLPLKN